MDNEKIYWVAFSVFSGIGPLRFRLLLNYFGSAKNAWEAPLKELQAIHVPHALTVKFDHFRKTFLIFSYLKQLESLHVHAIPLYDARYPKLLKEISDAPFVLYVKGKKEKSSIDMGKTVAVVGTRKASSYGIEVTKRLVRGLVSYGCTIISGMAYGIDGVAHQEAIDAGGKTIAVLGCGVDVIAPASHAFLYKQMTEEGFGAVVSEMPLSHRPSKGLFPARNRIISGLSLGTVVVEGAEHSGSLITARNAAEQGRDVFVVPGPITSVGSQGPMKLLKNGAMAISNADDIVTMLGIAKEKKSVHNRNISDSFFTKEEDKILSIIENAAMHIDEIKQASGLQMEHVSGILTVLEMKGAVKNIGEGVYTREI